MRVLIIGGTGLTGLPIARRLAAAGHDIFIISRGELPQPQTFSAHYLKVDRFNTASLQYVLESVAPEIVIDQFAFSSAHIDQIASIHPVRHLVCSTAAVLGAGFNLDEKSALSPHGTAYLSGKRELEERAEECEAIVLRPAYLYGPGHHPLTVHGRDNGLAVRIRNGETIDLPGDGSLPLQPTYAEDYAAAVEAILDMPDPSPIYHIGGTPTTWKGWLQAVASASGAILLTREVPFEVLKEQSELFRDYFCHPLTITSSCLPEIKLTSLEEGTKSLVKWMDSQ
ncbi:MAG: NAD-dependent epimerase/dehydratase family protein [Candidatus Scalindua rubra]|uniref:NAD dependent epimerase/dehydratase family protein n=1 Tax=Candidatus Scalindua brodae TaxID=237368 RepID=A0A0B0ES85_9BACT|nr:MAG: NAD dependent epimerase/dehydratase family protein [Candidatus Scalindua brodae]MBZ0108946.1 NAD-dependent epimerase/dehydratase family protein [Candidatus Scalindua rubra]TWU32140.1 NAD dependent epimerase/dehydratase family protein [Candidatus Brocadiaceae bacterium S225]